MNYNNLCMNCMANTGGKAICPVCGHNRSIGNDVTCLQPGTLIDSRYIIGMFRHKNGEGIEYIGYDTQQNKSVWIIEFFPGKLSMRSANDGIKPIPGYEAQYKSLLSDCGDIYSTVKRLGLSGDVVPIENAVFWGGTVYAVYSDTGAVKLEEYLRQSGGKIPVRRAVKMFVPLCATLSSMHDRGDIHRGISPQTVYIGKEGKLLLWGFALGATRTGSSEMESELFSGYSAPEQYVSNGWQGPWTDVYAVAALFYRCVSGVVPPKSTMVGPQRLIAPLDALANDIPSSVSNAVEHAMRGKTDERTQTISAFASKLILKDHFADTAATAVFEINKLTQANNDEQSGKPGGKISGKKDSESGVSVKYVILALFCTVLLLTLFMWYAMRTYFPDLISNSSEPPHSSSSVMPSDSSESESISSQSSETSESKTDKSVPKFVGFKYDTIKGDSNYGERFKFEKREDFNDNYEAGIIYNQSPTEGTLMQNRGVVVLFVSKGKLRITMPDLTDMTLEEVEEEFKKISEEYDCPVTFQPVEKFDNKVKAGKVISSNPVAGQEFNPKDENSKIFVYVAMEVVVSETRQESSKPSSSLPDTEFGERP